MEIEIRSGCAIWEGRLKGEDLTPSPKLSVYRMNVRRKIKKEMPIWTMAESETTT